MPSSSARLTMRLGVAAVLLVLWGCGGHRPPQPDYDPWERMNRKVFWFNDKADQYALEPVARGWNFVVPTRVQRAIGDFFVNLRFPIVLANDLLQRKGRAALESVATFEINTFFGGLGFYDLASQLGLPPQDEDTGQTFGVWAISPGPYVVLPFFGPSNPRDTAGLIGDAGLGFYTYFVTVPGITIGATAINVINERARYLEAVENAKNASLDYYTFVRNAYVQHRWKQVHDQLPGTAAPQDEDLYNDRLYEGYLEGDQP
jgi:phospholipid-binding lipoprotein MlaA